MGEDIHALVDNSMKNEEAKESKRSNTRRSVGRDVTRDGSYSDGVNAVEDGISGSELDDSGDLDSDEEFSEEDEDDEGEGERASEKSKSMANSAIMKEEQE